MVTKTWGSLCSPWKSPGEKARIGSRQSGCSCGAGHNGPLLRAAAANGHRRVIMLVMAGKPVDATIALLMEHLEEGDCIIDGGNEWWVA